MVSIDRPLINLHFRRLKKNVKGPRPFKQQKTFLSGKTTSQGASLNQGASGVVNRIAERPFYGFFIMPEWGVLGLEPNWQKSAKPVGIMYTEGGEGAVFNGLEKSTNNQMKNLRKCLLNSEYRNATSKYLKIMLFY